MAHRRVKTARALRQHETDLEHRLWQQLRNRRAFGLKFRRQHPIGPFVADFVCIEAKLVVEIDGYWHATRKQADERRTIYLQSEGYEVIRYSIESDSANVDELAFAIANEARLRTER